MYVVKCLAVFHIGFFVLFVRASATPNFIQRNTSVNQSHPKYIAMLLGAIQNEHNFSTLVLWRRRPEDCFTDISDLSLKNRYAQLIFNSSYTIYLNAHFNRALLNVVCLNGFVDQCLLDNMAENLQHMRETRVLFLLKNFKTEAEDDLKKLFTYCDQQQMLNVLAISENFAATGLLYTFQRFPNFTMEHSQWPIAYYPNRFSDLHGYQLHTMHAPDEPGSFVHTDWQGKKHSSGYIYHLISTYAAKLNASLTYKRPANLEASIEISILSDLTSNYKLDLPICLQMLVENMSLYECSGIVEISHWMPMLPRTGYLERYQIYKHIGSRSSLLIDVFVYLIFSLLYARIANGGSDQKDVARRLNKLPFNEVFFNGMIFRGVIGFPFQLRRVRSYKFHLLYFLIFLQGHFWSTVYHVQVNTFLNHPPSGEQINSYDDLKARHTKIAIPQAEFEVLERLMSESFMHSYKEVFLIIPELRDFYSLRKSLNTQYAYSVHTQIWIMIASLQKYFSQALFRISEEVQFHRQILWAVPLAENSVYRASFNAYLLDMQAYGFWEHWTAISRFEMAEAGKLSLQGLRKPLGYTALQFRDLYYIWLFYIIGTAIGCFCIIAELLHKNFSREALITDGRKYLVALVQEFKN